jgi:hypothetical protein
MQQNSGLLATIWRFLRPETEELIAYITAIGALGGVAAFQLASTGQIGADSQDIIAAVQQGVTSTADYLSSGSGWARFFLFGFWFVIGAIAYFVVWFLINIAIDLYNDIVISAAFIHPRAFHQSEYWASIAARVTLRVLAAIALGFYMLFWLWVFAPFAVGRFKALIQYLNVQHVLEATVTLVAIVLTLHVATVLIRLIRLKPNGTVHEHNL